MKDEERVYKDIVMFEENIATVDIQSLPAQQQKTIEIATQYYEDTKYYHKKQDYFTAFGCINYAHGLLDAVIKQW